MLLHGDRVGTLTRRDSLVEWEFDGGYWDRTPRPVLGQVFEERGRDRWSSSVRLPEWFSNLLPEGLLRDVVARELGVGVEQELALLGRLGRDLPGAVEVVPQGLGPGEPAAPRRGAGDRDGVRFSLAGVQLKFSAVNRSRRLTLPAAGEAGDLIVKLPDLRYEAVPENEFTVSQWARAAGIDVPKVELVAADRISGVPAVLERAAKGSVFVIERFDRSRDARVHTEDFAQLASVYPERRYKASSYDQLLRTVWVLCGEDDAREAVRRVVLHVLSGNGDAHLKNWSVYYPDRVTPRLAPAYDLLSTVVYDDFRDDALALRLRSNRAFSLVTAVDFAQVAGAAGHPRPQDWADVAEQAAGDLRRAWQAHRNGWPMPKALQERLDAHLARVALGR